MWTEESLSVAESEYAKQRSVSLPSASHPDYLDIYVVGVRQIVAKDTSFDTMARELEDWRKLFVEHGLLPVSGRT